MPGAKTWIERRNMENCRRSPTWVGVMKQIDGTLVVLMSSGAAPIRPLMRAAVALKFSQSASPPREKPRQRGESVCLLAVRNFFVGSTQLAVFAAAAVVAAELRAVVVVRFLAGNAEPDA